MNEVYKYFEDNIYYSVNSGKASIYLENDDLFEFEEMLKQLKINYSNLQKQLEAYENMRKELKNRIEYTNFKDVEDLEKFKNYLDELMNILNKVGGSDE